MNKPTFISIGIPFYNAEDYLEYAICSVLAQTHKHWELILIDDGSTDDSLDIAKLYARIDDRIRIISDGLNKKLPSRLNEIIKKSKYDYIARMDADDLMSNDRLEKQLKLLQSNQEVDLVTTGCLTIGKSSELTGIKLGKNYQMNAAAILKGSTNLLHASLLARKQWYLRNTYNEESLLAEDYDLWLQAAKRNDLNYVVIEDPLYWYRVTENVTLFKITNGYEAQMKIIKDNYKGIITKLEKEKIIAKFRLKKSIVKTLNHLNLLQLLLKLRSNEYNKKDLRYYDENIFKIKEVKI